MAASGRPPWTPPLRHVPCCPAAPHRSPESRPWSVAGLGCVPARKPLACRGTLGSVSPNFETQYVQLQVQRQSGGSDSQVRMDTLLSEMRRAGALHRPSGQRRSSPVPRRSLAPMPAQPDSVNARTAVICIFLRGYSKNSGAAVLDRRSGDSLTTTQSRGIPRAGTAWSRREVPFRRAIKYPGPPAATPAVIAAAARQLPR